MEKQLLPSQIQPHNPNGLSFEQAERIAGYQAEQLSHSAEALSQAGQTASATEAVDAIFDYHKPEELSIASAALTGYERPSDEVESTDPETQLADFAKRLETAEEQEAEDREFETDETPSTETAVGAVALFANKRATAQEKANVPFANEVPIKVQGGISSETYEPILREKVSESLSVLEEFGLDTSVIDQKVKRILFWPARDMLPHRGERGAIRAFFHKLRPGSRQLYADKDEGDLGFYLAGYSVNARLYEDGETHQDTLTHELMHATLDAHGIRTTRNKRRPVAALLDEGMGTLGNMLWEESVTGKPENPGSLAGMKHEIEDNVPIDHRLNSKANAAVHRYLYMERGGLDKLREVSQYLRRQPTQKKVLAAYEKVYGEPFTALLDKADTWYQERLDSGKIGGQR